ncbi:hypothetical protein Cgig2_025463 [Carnegiea gigantea]|uniref:Uncharacterized protein n=1 Tax=Carnegiea gigantea TaxID=171969 RepID=A0A9Q1JT39_9CARY|nr:hypothetical protein Cgig2_025463 [Carnegiea gigantea]
MNIKIDGSVVFSKVRTQLPLSRFHRGHMRAPDQANRNKGTKIAKKLSFLQMFHETHKKGTEFATPERAEKYVLGLREGVKPKDARGSYSTVPELEVQLNVTRRKNDVLTNRFATVKIENLVETKIMKVNNLVFQQFSACPTSSPCNGHETPGGKKKAKSPEAFLSVYSLSFVSCISTYLIPSSVGVGRYTLKV